MGPVSQGTANDLSNLVTLVQTISSTKGVAKVLEELNQKLDEINTRSATVSEREAVVASAEATVATQLVKAKEAEEKADKKLADADKKLADARDILKSAKVTESNLFQKEKALDERIVKTTADFERREAQIKRAEEKTSIDLEKAEQLRGDLESRVARIQQLAQGV